MVAVPAVVLAFVVMVEAGGAANCSGDAGVALDDAIAVVVVVAAAVAQRRTIFFSHAFLDIADQGSFYVPCVWQHVCLLTISCQFPPISSGALLFPWRDGRD